jgi:hypothetical protein
MRRLIAVLLSLSSAAAAPTAQPPEWLAGYWLACEAGRETVEVWITDGAETFVGVNQSKGAFEFSRIAAEHGRLVFFAQPQGFPPTRFDLTARDGDRLTFENPAHDFPQRVIYARKGDLLVGRIEGTIDGKSESVEWRFRRAAMGEHCD